MRQGVRPQSGDLGVQELYGSWSVAWRQAGFCVRGPVGLGNGSFPFNRILLPVEIVAGHVVLTLDPFSRTEILKGTDAAELSRFKRRLSGEVLAAVRTTPAGCADCASEAGLEGRAWDGSVCPGCREYYCRNMKCLRRLRLALLRFGERLCKHCGTENDPYVAARTATRRSTGYGRR
jgi:hypothetical protein